MNYPDHIASSGKNIYDRVHDADDLYLPLSELETTLRNGLVGMSLDYPLRTRSKKLKSKICEILGYPVPKSFRKTQPRFPGQDFDTYVQKSNNLQIWNEEISPTRRYVIIRVDELSHVVAVRVVTGEVLAKLDRTGTLTRKYQARSRDPVTTSELVTQSDAYGLVERVRSLGTKDVLGTRVDFRRFLPIGELFACLSRMVGTRIADPGADQERSRGDALHEAVCRSLGMIRKEDKGTCPDVLEQLLEVKLQTSPTIDLGLMLPDDEIPLDTVTSAKHCDVRYAVFYGLADGKNVQLDHLVMCAGRDFFKYFQRFEGKVVNKKLQIPLPSDFFD
jgi:hypothetical protein